jgi:hypothetical protein
MRSWIGSLAGLLAGALVATGQVTVELSLEQGHFLPGEEVPLKVRITNRSGQTLDLGDTADWLRFFVERKDGRVVVKHSEVPVEGKFSLDSSTAGIKRVNLAPHFDLDQIGRYTVSAVLRARQWEREWTSPPKTFDVVSGRKLWEMDFGVPSPTTGSTTPEMRKYALLQANHLKQLKLYFRLTDVTESVVFTVFPIGPIVSFSEPEAQVDREARLHTLYQTGARAFQYTVFDPDGKIVVRQFHDYGATRPRLRPAEEGGVAVTGGMRRLSRDDLPQPERPNPNPNAASSPP